MACVHLIDSVAPLSQSGANVTSQFGEDGIIASIFSVIGEQSRHCFECGAGDGFSLSNTFDLRSRGWSAVLIESSLDKAEECRQYETSSVAVIHATATPDNFDSLIGSGPFDLGVIDIDGDDYELFESMVAHPRVMIVEYAPDDTASRSDIRHELFGASAFPPLNGRTYPQAGFDEIVSLGHSKGYTCVASTVVNCVFVTKDEACKLVA